MFIFDGATFSSAVVVDVVVCCCLSEVYALHPLISKNLNPKNNGLRSTCKEIDVGAETTVRQRWVQKSGGGVV